MAGKRKSQRAIPQEHLIKEVLLEVLEEKQYVTRPDLEKILAEKDYVTEDYLDKKLDEKLDSKIGKAMTEQRLEYERYMGAFMEEVREGRKATEEGINMILELFSRESEDNKAEHKSFNGRINRLEAEAF